MIFMPQFFRVIARGFYYMGYFIFAISLLLTSEIVSAAVTPTLPRAFDPGSIEPGVIGRNISNSPVPLRSQQGPKFTLPHEPAPAPTSPEASKISFVLNGVIFKGNHVYTNSELQAIFQPYIHHKITVATLQKLVQEVTDKYQKKGYFLSKALLPPQEIKKGIVQVTIIEGFVSNVVVQGLSRKAHIKMIQRYGEKIKGIKPMKLDALERYLLLMNDIPGFAVKAVLEPDPKVPLGAKLTLLSQRTAVQAAVSYDNYQTPYLGPYETTLYSELNSVFTPGGTLYGRFLSGNRYRTLNFYELKHDQVIGTSGWLFTVDGYETKTNPQFILTPLELFGSNTDVNATLTYPLIRSRQRNLIVQGQFDYLNSSSRGLGRLLYNDEIRDISFSTRYNDSWWKGDNFISITFNKGLHPLNNQTILFSRAGDSGEYFRIYGVASREQHLNNRFSLFGLVTAQYSNKILPAAVAFTYGGPYIGRGYDWAQFIDDQGVAGKVEFRMNTSPNLLFLKQVQYYAFYDIGQLWSLIPNITSISGASAGFGLRANVIKHITAEGFIAKPLTAPNASQVVMGNSGHSFLGYFQVTATL